MEIIVRFVTRIVVPFAIAAVIFYLTKPPDEKCIREAVEKLATINIKASPDNIVVRDRVFLKPIKYISRSDTLSVGYGALFLVRFSDTKLREVQEHQANGR